MAGEIDVSAALHLVRDVVRISSAGFSGFFKKDCTDLARRVSLLAHLLEEITDSNTNVSQLGFLSDLTLALQAAKRLVFAANNFPSSNISSVSRASCLLEFVPISISSTCLSVLHFPHLGFCSFSLLFYFCEPACQ